MSQHGSKWLKSEDSAKKMKLSSYKVGVNVVFLMPYMAWTRRIDGGLGTEQIVQPAILVFWYLWMELLLCVPVQLRKAVSCNSVVSFQSHAVSVGHTPFAKIWKI